MTILDIVESLNFSLKKVSSTTGGEFCGPCPWCGGKDRFRLWPNHEKGTGGRYWCRQCDRSGDAIRFLMGAEPISVQAFQRFDEAHGVDGMFVGIMKFPGDRMAVMCSGMEEFGRNRYEVIGTKGKIDAPNAFTGGGRDTTVTVVSGKETKVEEFKGIDQYQAEIETVDLKCLEVSGGVNCRKNREFHGVPDLDPVLAQGPESSQGRVKPIAMP